MYSQCFWCEAYLSLNGLLAGFLPGGGGTLLTFYRWKEDTSFLVSYHAGYYGCFVDVSR